MLFDFISWPSQTPDGKGVSDKKSHSNHQTFSAGVHVIAGHETTTTPESALLQACYPFIRLL